MSPKETNATAAVPLHAGAPALSSVPAVSVPDPAPHPLRAALENPRYEVIPMRGALAEARKLPEGTTVSVTCSPNRGIEPTIRLAEEIKNSGYTVVPHLAAKRFHSHAHVNETLIRLTDNGIQDVFVVGGDGDDVAGPYSCGIDLLAALVEIQPELNSIGIPCYPEGHASITDQVLDNALMGKSHYASYMVSQICFEPGTIHAWLKRIRSHGIDLPLYIGMPGVLERRKLFGIAMRIGLGDSRRFLKKNSRLMGRLARPSWFTPDALVSGLGDMFNDPDLGLAGFHINTFNQVDNTESWRHERLDTSQYDQPFHQRNYRP